MYREPFCKSKWDESDECPLRYIDRIVIIEDSDEEVPIEPEPSEEDPDEDVDDPTETDQSSVDPNENNTEITARNGSAVITIVLITAIGGGFIFFLII